MLENIYYISGICVNLGLAYSLYKVIPILPKILDKVGELPKKEEKPLFFCKSTSSLESSTKDEYCLDEHRELTNEEKENKIEDRLKNVKHFSYINYENYSSWIKYLSDAVGKKKIN